MLPSVGIGALLGVQLPVGAVPDGADQGRLIRGWGVDGAQVRGRQTGVSLTSDLLVKLLDGVRRHDVKDFTLCFLCYCNG